MEFFDDENDGLFDSIHEQVLPQQNLSDHHIQSHHNQEDPLRGLYPHSMDHNLADLDRDLQSSLNVSLENPLDNYSDVSVRSATNLVRSSHNPHHNSDQLGGPPYSPALSFHGTPLLSPHALVPQSTTPNSIPGTSNGAGSARGSISGSFVGSANSTNEFGMYYQQPTSVTRIRRHSGKITKQSPSMRWSKSSTPFPQEEDFRLEDAALSFDLPPAASVHSQQQQQQQQQHQQQQQQQQRPQNQNQQNQQQQAARQIRDDDVEERLRSAIAATSKASSSSASTTNTSSRRASSVSSQRTTPRIRPKLNSTQASNGGGSANPSPLVWAFDANEEDIFSKSNYHNLVDGTHHHLGFTGADQMATELRSKKNVHKIAEQERRNRMNMAIADLSKVLPPLPEDDKTVASKAATVERATQYIKKLHQRIQELNGGKAVDLGSADIDPPQNNSGAVQRKGSGSGSSEEVSPTAIESDANDIPVKDQE